MNDTDIKRIIEREAAEIKDCLEQVADYSFAGELHNNMERAHLTSASLAQRCGVSRQAVDKWCLGKAKPCNKELMKRVGISLALNETELNNFLLSNGYPQLYIRNPFDCVAKYLLYKNGGKANNIFLYDQTIQRIRLKEFNASVVYAKGISGKMDDELRAAADDARIDEWFQENTQNFTESIATVKISKAMLSYLQAYMGCSINDFSRARRMPEALRKFMYLIFQGGQVSIRFFREKLITLGFYFNFTVEETDMLLAFARFRAFGETESKTEQAQAVALRRIHDRCPVFEIENLERVKRALPLIQNADLEKTLREKCEIDYPFLKSLAVYGEKHRSREDALLEEYYTSYSDRYISDYMYDIVTEIFRCGMLPDAEAENTIVTWHPTEECF